MIEVTWKEAGNGLIEALNDAGIGIRHAEGKTFCKPVNLAIAAQTIIDSFNSVPYEKKKAFERIVEQINDKMKTTLDRYPTLERETFREQELEARAYLADNTVDTVLMDEIVIRRGITLTVIANKIVSRADTMRTKNKKHSAERQKLFAQVKAGNNANTIRSINFDESNI